MSQVASDARTRIMVAAGELARERGPGNVSIEAVAAKAGLSKGGVLYHFRTKGDLLAALVSTHVEASLDRIEQSLSHDSEAPNALAAALVDAYRRERTQTVPRAPGLMAAVAEHPDLLCPLRTHHETLVARLESSKDPELAKIMFFALEGLKNQRLFGLDLLDGDQEHALLDRMERLLREEE